MKHLHARFTTVPFTPLPGKIYSFSKRLKFCQFVSLFLLHEFSCNIYKETTIQNYHFIGIFCKYKTCHSINGESLEVLFIYFYIAGRMKLYLLKGQAAILQTYLGKFYIVCTLCTLIGSGVDIPPPSSNAK